MIFDWFERRLDGYAERKLQPVSREVCGIDVMYCDNGPQTYDKWHQLIEEHVPELWEPWQLDSLDKIVIGNEVLDDGVGGFYNHDIQQIGLIHGEDRPVYWFEENNNISMEKILVHELSHHGHRMHLGRTEIDADWSEQKLEEIGYENFLESVSNVSEYVTLDPNEIAAEIATHAVIGGLPDDDRLGDVYDVIYGPPLPDGVAI